MFVLLVCKIFNGINFNNRIECFLLKLEILPVEVNGWNDFSEWACKIDFLYLYPRVLSGLEKRRQTNRIVDRVYMTCCISDWTGLSTLRRSPTELFCGHDRFLIFSFEIRNHGALFWRKIQFPCGISICWNSYFYFYIDIQLWIYIMSEINGRPPLSLTVLTLYRVYY